MPDYIAKSASMLRSPALLPADRWNLRNGKGPGPRGLGPGQYLRVIFRLGSTFPTRLHVANPFRTRSFPGSRYIKTFGGAHIRQGRQKYLRPADPARRAGPACRGIRGTKFAKSSNSLETSKHSNAQLWTPP